MHYLIGIDDTDNLDSHGTGHLARDLANTLSARDLAEIEGITRHQLLVDPRIRYTSHNSSACLSVVAQPDRLDALIDTCRQFLSTASARGSDAGLCMAEWSHVSPAVQHYGERAKRELVTMAEAIALAQNELLVLEGLTGDHSGIIGALAAVGLRASGNVPNRPLPSRQVHERGDPPRSSTGALPVFRRPARDGTAPLRCSAVAAPGPAKVPIREPVCNWDGKEDGLDAEEPP